MVGESPEDVDNASNSRGFQLIDPQSHCVAGCGAGAGNLFFQLVNARYERGAMILTSNRGFAEWGKVFGDPVVATALLDRLLHHAVVVHIEGASYRLRQHADLVPESLRPPQHPSATAATPRRRGRPPKTPPT
jgi:hypothetical protein